MARVARKSTGRVVGAGCGVDREIAFLHFMMRVLLLTGLAWLVWPSGASLAASQQQSAGGVKALAPSGAAQQALKAEETLISPNDLLFT